MKTEIKWKDSETYEVAITQWLIKYLKDNDIKETHFSRDAGLGKNDTDARTFRKLKAGNRHWSMVDICKLAGYFNVKPSAILARVEQFYEKAGIVIPGKTVEKIIEIGLAENSSAPSLISTWVKKGKSFYFLDCDPKWKSAAPELLQRVMDMTSKQIFPFYPEITSSFGRAWKNKGEDTIQVEYKTSNQKSSKNPSAGKRLLSINSKFVPPNFVVAYVNEIPRGL